MRISDWSSDVCSSDLTVLVLLLLSGWFFRDPLVVGEPSPADNTMPAGARMMVWPAAIALLIAGPVLAAGLSSPAPVDDMRLTAPAVAGWGGPQAVADDWRPAFNGAAGRVKGLYRSNADRKSVV